MNMQRVVVVGAGIMGCSVAYGLAKRGVSVTVVDAVYPGSAATGASFAWLNNQAFFRSKEDISDVEAKDYFGLHRLGLGAWRKLEMDIGDVGARWGGLLSWCASGSDEEERFEGELARRQAWGSPTRRVNRREIQELVPGCAATDVGAAFYGEDEGSLTPAIALATLTGACVRLGVEFRWPCKAERLLLRGDDVVAVRTTEGDLSCDYAVIACGVGSTDIMSEVGVTVRLVESLGAIVHLLPVPMFLRPVLLSPSVHVVQRADGRVAIADHYSGSPVHEQSAIDPNVALKRAIDVLPQLQHARVEQVTIGKRVLPQDGLPIIGRSQGAQNCVSISTNAAISLGPVLAQLLVSEILDGAQVDLLQRYSAARFEGETGTGKVRYADADSSSRESNSVEV